MKHEYISNSAFSTLTGIQAVCLKCGKPKGSRGKCAGKRKEPSTEAQQVVHWLNRYDVVVADSKTDELIRMQFSDLAGYLGLATSEDLPFLFSLFNSGRHLDGSREITTKVRGYEGRAVVNPRLEFEDAK